MARFLSVFLFLSSIAAFADKTPQEIFALPAHFASAREILDFFKARQGLAPKSDMEKFDHTRWEDKKYMKDYERKADAVEARLTAFAEAMMSSLQKVLPRFKALHPRPQEIKEFLQAPFRFNMDIRHGRALSMLYDLQMDAVPYFLNHAENLEDWMAIANYRVQASAETEKIQMGAIDSVIFKVVEFMDESLSDMSRIEAQGFRMLNSQFTYFGILRLLLRDLVPQAKTVQEQYGALRLLLRQSYIRSVILAILENSFATKFKQLLVKQFTGEDVSELDVIDPKELAQIEQRVRLGFMAYMHARSNQGYPIPIPASELAELQAVFKKVGRYELIPIPYPVEKAPHWSAVDAVDYKDMDLYIVVQKEKPKKLFQRLRDALCSRFLN
jgi:hypothetical protein